MLHYTVSETLDSWSSLAECFWLKVYHEVVVKLLARATVITEIGWGWKICFQTHSHGCWQVSAPFWMLARGFSSSLCGPLHRSVHSMAAFFFPQNKWPYWDKVHKMETTVFVFFNLISEMTYQQFYCMLLVT